MQGAPPRLRDRIDAVFRELKIRNLKPIVKTPIAITAPIRLMNWREKGKTPDFALLIPDLL